MKKEIIKQIIFANRGGLVLMAIALTASVLAGIVSMACDAGYSTAVFMSQISGVLATSGLFGLFEIAKMDAPMGPGWGVFGTILGMVTTMILY